MAQKFSTVCLFLLLVIIGMYYMNRREANKRINSMVSFFKAEGNNFESFGNHGQENRNRKSLRRSNSRNRYIGINIECNQLENIGENGHNIGGARTPGGVNWKSGHGNGCNNKTCQNSQCGDEKGNKPNTNIPILQKCCIPVSS